MAQWGDRTDEKKILKMWWTNQIHEICIQTGFSKEKDYHVFYLLRVCFKNSY